MNQSRTGTSRPDGKFPLGDAFLTVEAANQLAHADVVQGILRHRRGDWGDVSPEDAAANEAAIENGELRSVYHDRNGAEFWIITSTDRSTTVIGLPHDC
jgi:hypothetical protein